MVCHDDNNDNMKIEAPKCSSLRWIANVSEDTWKATSEQLKMLTDLLPANESERISKMRRAGDSRRATMGRVMLRAAASQGLGKAASDIEFSRTKGGKPMIHEAEAAERGLNANVSHHGDWVVLGMEEEGLVGVDVSSTTAPRANLTAEAYFSRMKDQLTAREWAAVRGAGASEEEQYHAFFVLWALKEAYSKAVGVGVCLPFSRLELSAPARVLCKAQQRNAAGGAGQRVEGEIRATLDGVAQSGWRFEVYSLDAAHVMAAAVGPHAAAVPSWHAARAALAPTPPARILPTGTPANLKPPAPGPVARVEVCDLLSPAEAAAFRSCR